jgi:glucose/arabinose dehydrogenase
MRRRSIASLVFLFSLAITPSAFAQRAPACDADNAGLKLPAGFCAIVFADSVPGARHLVVTPSGEVLVATRNARDRRGGIVSLRDSNGDGKADQRAKFGDNGGNGIFLRGENLWFATNDAVLRYRFPRGNLIARTDVDTIVRDLPTGGHGSKSIVVGRDNDLYVNIGSLSNACQQQNRQARSPGIDPCVELDTRAGIWRFNAMEKNQRPSKDKRFATGLRNTNALTFAPDGRLYGAQHGRDNLGDNWGFSDADNAEKPAEILVHIESGDDYGWPYCYYDQDLKRNVLAPEYGGDGKQVGDRCDDVDEPLAAFPGHWAPNGLVMYDGRQFPERYRRGFFVAFHGSWNRAPLPQAGYNVAFVPMRDGKAGAWEVFADGFAGATVQPQGAAHRPVGVAVGPDGSLFVTDDAGGRIYRISYRGN